MVKEWKCCKPQLELQPWHSILSSEYLRSNIYLKLFNCYLEGEIKCLEDIQAGEKKYGAT